MYLRLLDGMFNSAGYANFQLQYVDWDVALPRLHEMCTDEIPWDEAVLAEFAEASARRAGGELREMYPDEIPWDGVRRGIGPPGAP